MKILRYLLIILGSVYFLVVGACGGDSTTAFDTSNLPSTAPPLPSPTTAENLSIGVVDFLEYETISYKIMEDGAVDFDTSSGCSIDKDDTSNKDIKCVVDVMEQDLYFQGIIIEVIIPTDTCAYTTLSAPWHYNYEPGIGPVDVDVTETYLADGVTHTGSVCSVTSTEGEVVASCATDEYQHNGPAEAETCIYDHTDSEGPNCCIGDYSYDLITDVAGTLTSSSFTRSWGEDFSACVAGPAANSGLFSRNAVGLPQGIIRSTQDDGFADRIELTGPINGFNALDNHTIANWYDNVEECENTTTTSCGNSHYHQTALSGVESWAPVMVEPLEDRDQSSLVYYGGQDAFEVRCMDEARETLHRIRLYVREYNTKEKFDEFVSNPVNGEQEADETGDEDTNCGGLFGDCNDFSDMDNFFITTGGDDPDGGGYVCTQSYAGFTNTSASCFPQTD